MVVNPNLVRAQIEGGIGLALTTTLKTRITFTNGATDQSNFTDYPLLSMEEWERWCFLPSRPPWPAPS